MASSVDQFNVVMFILFLSFELVNELSSTQNTMPVRFLNHTGSSHPDILVGANDVASFHKEETLHPCKVRHAKTHLP